VAAGVLAPPDPDVQADMYLLACELLGRAGYRHYEVSNWARPGYECRHNLGYWERRPYLGLGAGAHSFRDGRRWWNVRPPGRYIELVGRGGPATGGEELLGAEEDRMEGLLLSLRQAAGPRPRSAARRRPGPGREGAGHDGGGAALAHGSRDAAGQRRGASTRPLRVLIMASG
jgi:oxygen-independent coproporphyrinogen-3 oxidase